MTKTAPLHVTRAYDFSAERVFDAWLDPHKAGKFLFSTPTGEMVKVELDARVGGKFCFVDRRDGDDIEHTGEYVEIDRPNRLVFDFCVPKFSPLTTRVTIEIVAKGSGCELVLTHEGVTPEWRDSTVEGWSKILDQLDDVIESSSTS